MKLMYDNTDVSFEQELSEGVEKKYRIKGIFSTPEKQNKNGRIYPRTVWEREVAKYQDILKTGHPNCLMELDHPPRSNVDMMEAVAKMEKLYFENGYVMGEAVLLDNPKANQLKTLIDNGIKMSVSSRGVGSVKGNLVENYSLITFDIIPNLGQSNYESEMYGIVEGVLQDKNFLITESGEIKEVQVEISEKEENLDEANKKILDAKYQLEINQIFNDDNIETMLKIASKIENKTDSHMLTKYLNLLKSVDIKPTEKVRLILEELENSDIPEKVELSEAQKAELRDNIINKFKEIFNSSLNEGIKVNSKISAIQVIQMAKDKISDEKVKDMLDSSINFLAKEFNIELK